MRKLKTPEEIRKEVGSTPWYTLEDLDKLIIAAQRDALECVNYQLNKMVDKVDNDETINIDDREVYTLGLNQLGSFIYNLIPKE